MRKILVTAISGNVANGILKILSEKLDELYGCDIYDYPVGMDKVKYYWKSDKAVEPQYIENLVQKCSRLGITHLIPVNEEEIKVISHNIEVFHAAGIKVMINDSFVIDVFMDKYKTVQYLNKLSGIAVPETYEYEDFQEDGKKYIVKLKQSCGSKFLEIITEKKELEKFCIDKKKCVIQEYLEDAEEYTAGVFSDGEKISTIVFKRKLTHGYSSFVELVQGDSIEKEAAIIARNIHLKGYINIQYRKYHDRNYIFEINPRISGTVVFRHMLGFEDVIWWLDVLDNHGIPDFHCRYHTAIGLRELTEKFVVLN